MNKKAAELDWGRTVYALASKSKRKLNQGVINNNSAQDFLHFFRFSKTKTTIN